MAGKEINKEKLKALQLTMEKLDKTYGKGTVMKLGDEPVEQIEVIPTGSLTPVSYTHLTLPTNREV